MPQPVRGSSAARFRGKLIRIGQQASAAIAILLTTSAPALAVLDVTGPDGTGEPDKTCEERPFDVIPFKVLIKAKITEDDTNFKITKYEILIKGTCRLVGDPAALKCDLPPPGTTKSCITDANCEVSILTVTLPIPQQMRGVDDSISLPWDPSGRSVIIRVTSSANTTPVDFDPPLGVCQIVTAPVPAVRLPGLIAFGVLLLGAMYFMIHRRKGATS